MKHHRKPNAPPKGVIGPPGGTLVVGDVHACASELGRLLQRVRPDRLVMVGDLFTKGPDPVGTWVLLRKWQAEAVMGNHDAAVLANWRRMEKRGLPGAARRWLEARPLVLEDPAFTVVHGGLHPTEGPAGTTRAMALNLRRWPDDSRGNPFWWERYTGEALVVYGHDARRGLLDRRPHTLGLDTGCVYGGWLTGYRVEADSLVSVRAARVYKPVR